MFYTFENTSYYFYFWSLIFNKKAVVWVLVYSYTNEYFEWWKLSIDK